MSVARHHHFLSQCYLKGFTSNGGKKSKLTVIDLKERKTFESNTRNVGGVRDFNRLELDGVDPNYLESSLAEFEGSVATHLRKLEEGKDFSGETKDIILEFISLLAIRTPAQREHLSSPLKQIAKFIMKSSVSSAERWEDCKLAYEKEKGESLPYDLAYEKIKDYVDGDNFEINVIREFMIGMEMQCVPVIAELLHQRDWSLGFAPIFPDTCYHLTHYWPAAADIPVASDNPVHYADAIRYNARTPLQGSLLPLTRLV